MKTKDFDKKTFIDSLREPFKYKESNKNNLSIAASNRWNNPLNLLKIAYSMIDDADKAGISYSLNSPEDWDNLFENLGGGRKYRKSQVFLKVMSWEQFLENIDNYIKSK